MILEKDIWVCWAIDALFSMPDPHPMAFKGGTSLSKVYGVIDRFSEDVDITLDYRAFDDGFDPFADGASRTATKRFSERLRDRVASHVRDAVAPALDNAARRLAPDGHYEIHVGEDGETVRFAYPSAVDAPDSYVASEVLLEFGGRNVIDPNERHAIIPDMAALTDGLDYPAATVTVLCPARTFWEKATLIHVACHRRQLANKPDRLSRHWFDLMCLAANDIGRAAIVDRNLLVDVNGPLTRMDSANRANLAGWLYHRNAEGSVPTLTREIVETVLARRLPPTPSGPTDSCWRLSRAKPSWAIGSTSTNRALSPLPIRRQDGTLRQGVRCNVFPRITERGLPGRASGWNHECWVRSGSHKDDMARLISTSGNTTLLIGIPRKSRVPPTASHRGHRRQGAQDPPGLLDS